MENDDPYLCVRCKTGIPVGRSRLDWARVCRKCLDKERDWSKVKRNRVRDYKAEYQQRKAKNGKD